MPMVETERHGLCPQIDILTRVLCFKNLQQKSDIRITNQLPWRSLGVISSASAQRMLRSECCTENAVCPITN